MSGETERRLSGAARGAPQSPALFAAFAAVALMVVASLLVGLAVIFQSRDQSRQNLKHINCIVAVFARTDPPACRDVRDKLYRDGILPTTTTTTP